MAEDHADRIPEEVIEKEVRRLIRRIASMVVHVMSHRDMRPEDLDARLGWARGTTARRLAVWSRGELTRDMVGIRTLVRLTMAMGTECEIKFNDLEDLVPSVKINFDHEPLVHPAPEG